MKKTVVCAAVMVLLLASGLFAVGNPADAILGEWYTDGDESVVEIYKCEDAYCGKIVWLKEPLTEKGEEKTDQNNPDESMQDRPIIGLNIVEGFRFDDDNEWKDGTIYDPNKGKTYSCKAELKGDKLKIRGYIGISAFGRTTIWKRKK
jgi:uncharacterized protein (DUF2147 family)